MGAESRSPRHVFLTGRVSPRRLGHMGPLSSRSTNLKCFRPLAVQFSILSYFQLPSKHLTTLVHPCAGSFPLGAVSNPTQWKVVAREDGEVESGSVGPVLAPQRMILVDSVKLDNCWTSPTSKNPTVQLILRLINSTSTTLHTVQYSDSREAMKVKP